VLLVWNHFNIDIRGKGDSVYGQNERNLDNGQLILSEVVDNEE